MNEWKSGIPLPSDFLLDNHKSLQRRNDFEDMCESLDDLFFDAIAEAFQQGVKEGQEKTIKNLMDEGVIGLIEGSNMLEGLVEH